MLKTIPPSRYPPGRVTVDDYHRMIEAGVFDQEDHIELIEERIVLKIARGPKHDGVCGLVDEVLRNKLPDNWFSRGPRAVTTNDSEPETDLSIVCGRPGDYRKRPPAPADIGLIVEAAVSSVSFDRNTKCRV